MIKCIIFDFGDVFLNLDKKATAEKMKRHRIPGLSRDLLQTNEEFEKGALSTQEFMAHYFTEHPQLSEQKFVECWNAILVNFPAYRFHFIKKLSEEKKFTLILLSNTNEIHINWVKKNVSFFEDFKNCFDAFYLSHQINFRKPNANIYEFVLKENNLQARNCLFIDDTPENTKAAEKLGMHSWNLQPGKEDVVDLFSVKASLFDFD